MKNIVVDYKHDIVVISVGTYLVDYLVENIIIYYLL